MATINAMLDLLVQPMYNAIRGSPVSTNNVVAKLHYKVTASVLVIVGFLITSNEHFGNAIDCIQNPEVVPSIILETYCWVHSTFTLVNTSDSAYSGVDKETKHTEAIYHKYYQWVCLVLIFQSVFFYLPRYIWRLNEGRFFSQLLATENADILAKYFITHRGSHSKIATYFHVTEFFFLFNLIVQICLTDMLLNYQFIPLGIVMFTQTGHLERVFPRMAKCRFHMYGPSGDVQRQDALCLLGQNVFNEKIFIFLWFWYLMLFILSGTVTLWRLATLYSRKIRVLRLMAYFNAHERFKLKKICNILDFSDFYVLATASKNISPIMCRQLYLSLYKGLVRLDKRYSEDELANGSIETAHLT